MRDILTNHPTMSRAHAVLLAALAFLLPRPSAAQSYQTIYSFKASPDGAQPEGGLVIGGNGVLYGTTLAGGTSVLGTVYELTYAKGKGWKETVLHNFNGSDGQYPQSPLVFGSAGALYGVTAGGGPGGSGTIFELAPPATAGGAWTETVLYGFSYSQTLVGQQNVNPNGPLFISRSGTIYTTTKGSPNSGGAIIGLVVALVPPATSGGAWTEYELYSFGDPQGEQPMAGVVSQGGLLYGTTEYEGDYNCGPYGCGTVYELTPPASHSGAWTETTIYTFGAQPNDGDGSLAPLTQGPGGVFYGTTSVGGSGVCLRANGGGNDGCGTVFQLTPPIVPGGTWTESLLYSFTGTNGDGSYPAASVVVGKNGALYGTTQYGGSATSACPASYDFLGGCGTVFKLTPPTALGGAWTEQVLHDFTDANGDGANPVAPLVLSSTGVFYGTTSAGGTAGKGTIFAVAP